MNFVSLVLFYANMFCAFTQGILYIQNGSLVTLALGVANALACVLLTHGHFQQEKRLKEWDEMVRKRMEDWDNIGT